MALARTGPTPIGYYGDAKKTAEVFVTIDGVLWVRSGDQARIDANGDIVVTGTTEGQLGAYLAGGSDFFVARYTNTGAQTSLKQFGTAADEEAYGVARGIAGSLFVVGRTAGSMNEDSGGGDDGFVSRIT